MKEKREVIKHSAAIHIQNDITLLQRRAWNVLLANAYDELLSEEEHRVKVHDLMHVLEFDSKNEDYLKEALKALMTCMVEWNVLGKNRDSEWGATTLLAQAKIRQGICTYAYSPELRRRLHNPRMYARISLSMQNKFESKHAQALWEVCVDYLDETRNYGETPFIPLTAYRKLMGIAEDMYPELKKLNEWVIKSSVKEINKVTDFHVEVEYKREGRKITALKFKVRRVLEHPGQVIRQGKLFPEIDDMPLLVKELKDAGLSAGDAWEIHQHRFEYVNPEKRPHGIEFEAYIREKIHLLKRRQATGKVENSTGFLLRAIKANYANPEFAAEEKKRGEGQRTKAKHTNEHKRQRLEAQKDELQKARSADLHQACVRIAKESLALIEEALGAVLQENPAYRRYYQAGKTPIENYQNGQVLWVFVDQYLEKHYPERFQSVQDSYAARLAEIEQEMSALGQAAA